MAPTWAGTGLFKVVTGIRGLTCLFKRLTVAVRKIIELADYFLTVE